jgi:glutaminase
VGYRRIAGVALVGVLIALPAGAQVPAKAQVEPALTAALTKYKDLKEGKNADYIPALAKVPSNLFGIAVVTVDGQVYTAGDVTQLFSISNALGGNPYDVKPR